MLLQRPRRHSAAALSIAAASVMSLSSAYAAIAISFVQLPLSSSALSGATFDDATLLSYDVFDIQITTKNGAQFLAGDVRAQFFAHTYYIPPANDQNIPQALRVSNGTRYLKADNM